VVQSSPSAATQFPSPQSGIQVGVGGGGVVSQNSVAAHRQSSPGPPQFWQFSPGSQLPSPQNVGQAPQSAGQPPGGPHVSVPPAPESKQQPSPQLSPQLSAGHRHGFSPGSQVPSLLQLPPQTPAAQPPGQGQSIGHVVQFSPCPASQDVLPQKVH
jgi:hypothetical protein